MKESKLSRALTWMIDIIFSGLLWCLFSLPLVTIGAASSALYYAAAKCIRHDRGRLSRVFWDGFRKNFKSATRMWLLYLAAGAVGAANVFAAFQWGGTLLSPLTALGGMILLYLAIGIPMSTFLIRGLMDSIPMDLEEAAYIDGCGFFGRFFHIILPLSRTGIVTAATFEFLTCWNEFVFANLIVSSEKLRTIQVGIRYFTNQFSTDYVSMYAAIVISIVPSILGYVLFQEQIISGMTSGAVKG